MNTVSLGKVSTTGIGIIVGISIPLLVCITGEFIKSTVEVVKEYFSSQEKNSNNSSCTANGPNDNEQQPSNTLRLVDSSEIEGRNKGLVT